MADEIRHVVSIEANLAKIQTQLKTLEGNFNSSFRSIQGAAASAGAVIGSALGVGLSVAGLVVFAKRVIDVGDQLSDLHDQTGNSIELLGGIRPVLEQNNTSLDGFAKGMARAQRSLGDIGGSGREAAEGFRALGLSAAEMAALAPDEFLERFANALAKVANRNERAAIAQRVLGRSAAELVPSLLALADKGIPKLDSATAEAYRKLGALKDQLTVFGVELINVSAEPLTAFIEKLYELLRVLNLLPKTSGETLEGLKATVKNLTEKSATALGIDPAQLALFDNAKLNQLGQESGSAAARGALTGLLEARRQLDEFITKTPFSPPKAPAAGATGGLKNLLPDKKQQDQAQSFLEGLNKQLDALQSKQVGQLLGPQAELGAQLDAAFKEFTDKLAGDKIPIPKGLEAEFNRIKTAILGANLQLTQMAAEMDKVAAIGKVLNQDSAEWLNVDEDLTKANEKAAEFKKQLDDLRQGLQVGAIDTRTPAGAERKRVTEIEIEFVRTATRITELGQQAGATQEQIAADVALAWNKALVEIGIEPDFAGLDRELQRIGVAAAVFGNSFDAVSAKIDATKKAIQGLIDQGLDEFDPKIQILNDRLKNLEGVEALRDSFSNVFDAIEKGLDSTLQGVLQGTQSFGDAMRNLARNILLSITNEINKNFILKPLREQFQKLLPQAPAGGAPVPGIAGALGQTPQTTALTSAGTSLTGSAVSLNTAASALTAAAGALSGTDIGAELVPNIQEFANIAAPQEIVLPDLSEWSFELADQAEDGFDVISDSVSQGLDAVIGQSESGFSGLFSTLGSLLSSGIESLTKSIGGLFGASGGESSGLASGISKGISTAISFIGSFFEEGGAVAPRQLPLAFAAGGEVPAILHEGEFVLRKSAVDKIGLPTLQKMNAGIPTQHFATGGYVRSAPIPRAYQNGGVIAGAVNEIAKANNSAQSVAPKFAVDVNIRGGIVPEKPNLTKEDVIQIGIRQLDNRGSWMSVMEQRTSIKGG